MGIRNKRGRKNPIVWQDRPAAPLIVPAVRQGIASRRRARQGLPRRSCMPSGLGRNVSMQARARCFEPSQAGSTQGASGLWISRLHDGLVHESPGKPRRIKGVAYSREDSSGRAGVRRRANQARRADLEGEDLHSLSPAFALHPATRSSLPTAACVAVLTCKRTLMHSHIQAFTWGDFLRVTRRRVGVAVLILA